MLKCVDCGESNLQITATQTNDWCDYVFESSSIKLSCSKCRSDYPVTHDGIPIMWTSFIKKILLKDSGDLSNSGETAGFRALSANISSYERISDDYSKNWRNDEELVNRIKNGARILFPATPKRQTGYHLDIGCGTGQVIGWVKPMGFTQIGLDVSLANLRNTKSNTGAYVILGDATAMPFNDCIFKLVTGSAILHHIFEWKDAIRESCRVCNNTDGGIMFDSEPTVESLALSQLAKLVFDFRWIAYKLLSYIKPERIHFRDIAAAKLYYRSSETHNQPGLGIAVPEVSKTFDDSEFKASIYLSPRSEFLMVEKISVRHAGWKRIVLHLLSGHNPLLAKYGSFTVLARSNSKKSIMSSGGTDRETAQLTVLT